VAVKDCRIEEEGGGGKNQKSAMAIMGEDAKENECVRASLLTFETEWVFLVLVWV